MNDSPTVLTIDEAARYLRVSRWSVYNAVRIGELPAQRLGRRWLIHRPTIEAWLARQ